MPFKQRPDQRAQPFARVLNRFPHFKRTEFRLLPGAVLHGLHIECKNLFLAVAANFLVKALTRLVTQPPALHHFFDHRGHFVPFARFIIGRGLINVLYHVNEHVESHKVRRSKGRRFWPSDRRAGARIHFFHRHPQRFHQPQCTQHGIRSDAIGDEIRRIFSQHQAFAEPPIAEFAKRLDNLTRSLRSRNDFH